VNLGVVPYSSGGFIGVLVFFALSGYLICGILWRAPATLTQYRRYLRRRVERLAPAVTAFVAIGVPTMVLVGGQDLRSALVAGALTLTQTTAFALAAGHPVHPAWIPTWSLTVEWTFYVLFPLVLIGLRARGLSPRAIRGALAALAVVLYGTGLLLSPRAFYLLPAANLSVMLAGAVLAITHATPPRPAARPEPARAAGALTMLGILVVAPVAALSPGYRFIVFPAVTAAALVVINETRHPGRARAGLGKRPLALIGTCAYSLYLWHVPVMWLTFVTVPRLPGPILGLLSLIVMVPVVTASYWFLERPLLRCGRSLADAQTGLPSSRPAPASTVRQSDLIP
jgi:peptidoglycan/LPS O-acetylase OafA/YrhL